MSKGFLAFGILASAIIYDPQRMIGLLGPQAQLLGWHISSTIESYLPRIARRRG